MQIAAQSSDEEEVYAPMGAPEGQSAAYGATDPDAADAQVSK